MKANISSKLKALCCGASMFCFAGAATAGGFEVKETVSPELMATAQADIAASDCLSGSFVNPAVMGLAGKSQILPIVHYLAARTKFSGTSNRLTNSGVQPANIPVTGGNGGNPQDSVIIPAFYAMWNVYAKKMPKVWLGFSVTSPWGQSTQYPSNWKGRHLATKTELITFNSSLMAAVEAHPRLIIGGGIQLQRVKKVELERVVLLPAGPANTIETKLNLNGDDPLGAGWFAGFVWKMTDNTRLGVGYKSKINHVIGGTLDRSNSLAVNIDPLVAPGGSHFEAKLTTPASTTLSVVHKFNNWITGMAGFTYTQWNVFKSITARFPDSPAQPAIDEPQQWNNTWHLKVGCELTPIKDWKFRAGFAYDQTPTVIAHRSPRLPDADRFWIALGATWQFAENWNAALSYVHVFIRDAKISHPATQTGANPKGSRADLFGSFKASADIVTASVNWKFDAPQL